MREHSDTQRLLVPRDHATTLVRPQPLDSNAILKGNHALFLETDLQLSGKSLHELRRLARQDVVRLAIDHSSRYQDVSPDQDANQSIVLSGHQPALYHPGVWFKNFLADRMAKNSGGIAVNVIIDSDVAPAPSVAALAGDLQSPKPARIAYDAAGLRASWELTATRSLETFRSFGERLRSTISPFVEAPIVSEFWKQVLAAHARTNNPGLSFSQARHMLEVQADLQILDVPYSQLSKTEWFAHVAAEILLRAEQFQSIYNEEVQSYRLANRIRSISHPVPNLEFEPGIVEVPFWIYSPDRPERRRVWLKTIGETTSLTDQQGWQHELSKSTLVDSLVELQQHACLRTRALTTTMVLRLLASDVMIHGIGGSQYDRVTDQIIRRFFGITPPQFVTATATALLPVSSPDVSPSDLRRVDRQLRDAMFNPERVISRQRSKNEETLAALIEEKQSLIQNVPEFPEKRTWHSKLERINDQIRKYVGPEVESLGSARERIQQQLKQRALLRSREYSFCMYPQESLMNLLLDLAIKEA